MPSRNQNHHHGGACDASCHGRDHVSCHDRDHVSYHDRDHASCHDRDGYRHLSPSLPPYIHSSIGPFAPAKTFELR